MCIIRRIVKRFLLRQRSDLMQTPWTLDKHSVRLAVFFVFSGLMFAQSVGVVPLYGAAISWDIASGYSYRPSNSYGLIRFNTGSAVTQWAFSGDYVVFTSISVGGGLAYSSLGFSCSSNADMNISSVTAGSMVYVVTATAGQVSTTKIRFPSDAVITDVLNDDSYTYTDVTDVLTVTKTHGGSETITVSFTDGGGGLDEFVNIRSMWMNVFQLIVVVVGLALVNSVMRGELQITGYWGLIMLAVFTAILMILLSVTGAIWPGN